jgi:hypothetical protein
MSHIKALEPRHLAGVIKVVNDLVTPGENRRHVELAGHRLCRPGDPPCLIERLGGSQQRLGGHARVVGALAADQLCLDNRHRLARVTEATRENLAGRPGSDHDHVIGPVALNAHQLSLVRGHGAVTAEMAKAVQALGR